MFSASLIIGLAALLVVVVTRRLPGISQLVAQGKRPWACNACMSAWTALSVSTACCWDGDIGNIRAVMVLAMSGGGACYVMLEVLEWMAPGEIPPPPPEEEEDADRASKSQPIYIGSVSTTEGDARQ